MKTDRADRRCSSVAVVSVRPRVQSTVSVKEAKQRNEQGSSAVVQFFPALRKLSCQSLCKVWFFCLLALTFHWEAEKPSSTCSVLLRVGSHCIQSVMT